VSTPLDPFGGAVTVGSVTLRTPGLAGSAESYPAGSPGIRNAEFITDDLEQALINEHVKRQETVVLTDTAEIEVAGVQTGDEPVIEVEVPHPGERLGQVVLYVDESGVSSWTFASDKGHPEETTRVGATQTYVIRRFVPPAPEHAGTRGLIGAGALGKKLLKVLVFPLVDPDPLIGKVGDYFAHRWEKKKRPYRTRSFTPEDYASGDSSELGADDWRRLSEGPALLLVHGTLSRAHIAFGSLPRDYVEQLHDRYCGRVLAFDHFTLSEDPKENVDWLAQHIPDGTTLEFDVLCHSRGGLVSRVLAEKQSELSLGSRAIRVRNTVFVATPNAGTALAQNFGNLVDTYTNLLKLLPDTGGVEVIEGVITVMKQIAIGALKGLDGLQAMRPQGPFLNWLNTGPAGNERYFALGSNYEPAEPGFASSLDLLIDRVFKQADNDLVVPTAGVYEKNGSPLFPIAERHLFAAADAVPHTRYFASGVARAKISEWLTGQEE